MTDTAPTMEVPKDRPTQPESFAGVMARLSSIEQQLAHIANMLTEVLSMATAVHAENVDLISRVATLEDEVDIIKRTMKRRAKKKAA